MSSLINAELPKCYLNFSLNYEDYTRLLKYMEKDEKIKVQLREKRNNKARVLPMQIYSVSQSEVLKVLCIDIKKNTTWILTIKCPYCKEKHDLNCGSDVLPELKIFDSVCDVKLNYEVMLDSAMMKKMKSFL